MKYIVEDLKKDIAFSKDLRGSNYHFRTTWGLFSPERIDEGTELLINELEIKESNDTLDLGSGYGPIGLVMAKSAPKGITHFVDRDFIAVEYCKKNAELNGIRNIKIYLSNGFDNVPKEMQFDVIASNLPAKPSKELYWILFNDAKMFLKPGGVFYVVVISGLKEFIKRNFKEIFGSCEKLRQGRNYAVFSASKK